MGEALFVANSAFLVWLFGTVVLTGKANIYMGSLDFFDASAFIYQMKLGMAYCEPNWAVLYAEFLISLFCLLYGLWCLKTDLMDCISRAQ